MGLPSKIKLNRDDVTDTGKPTGTTGAEEDTTVAATTAATEASGVAGESEEDFAFLWPTEDDDTAGDAAGDTAEDTAENAAEGATKETIARGALLALSEVATNARGLFRRHRWQLLIFLTEFVYMGLELLASRLMSPWFGTTLDVWTAILGIVLLSSAVGNWLGGRVADGDRCRRWLATGMMLLAVSLFALPWLSSELGPALSDDVTIPKTVLASLALFVLPGVCLGSFTPMVVSLHSEESEGGIGRKASEVYVAMTLGGIVGTFVTGFVLVPTLGSETLSLLMGDVALVLSVALLFEGALWGVLWPVLVAAAVAFSLGTGRAWRQGLSTGREERQEDSHDRLDAWLQMKQGKSGLGTPTGGVDFWQDTRYGRAHVYDALYYGEPVRVLAVDGGFESAMPREEGKEEDLVFEYAYSVCDLVKRDARKRPANVLCLGGGAYSVPRNLASDPSGMQVDVMEIDEGITEIAREWFHLAEVEERSDGRLRSITSDARVGLADGDSLYTVIFNDTFAGTVPARTLSTVEAVRAVKSRLTSDGLYISNVIGRVHSDKPSFLAWEAETMRQVFKHVYVVQQIGMPENWDDTQTANYLIVATDRDGYEDELPDWAKLIELTGDGEVKVLTDDYSPVEWLTAQMKQR